MNLDHELQHAKLRLFPWQVPVKVRYVMGAVGLAWGMLNCMAFYTLLGLQAGHAQAAAGVEAFSMPKVAMVSLVLNGAIACALVWQLPVKPCPCCGRPRKEHGKVSA